MHIYIFIFMYIYILYLSCLFIQLFAVIGVHFLNSYSSWSLEKRNTMLFIEKY